MIQKLTSGLLTGIFVLLVSTAVHAQQPSCFQVDLQAVSISPVEPNLKSGKLTRIEVIMLNNGPCILPVGDATAQITINIDHLEFPADLGFTDECGYWSFLTSTVTGNVKNLFFRNTRAAMPVGGKQCAFYFNVKAKSKSPGVATITLASSLSAAAKTSDMNGMNQSAYAEIVISDQGSEGPKLPPGKDPKKQVKLNSKSNDCLAVLDWETPVNIIDSFAVEISSDKTNFEKIKSLNSTPGSEKYKFETDQGNARKYYRLNILYKDGTKEYSTVTEVETKCKIKKGF